MAAGNRRFMQDQEDSRMNGKDPPGTFPDLREIRCSICLQILERHGIILKTNFRHCESCSLRCCEDCAFVKSDIEWLCPKARGNGPVEKRLAKLNRDPNFRRKVKNKENKFKVKKPVEERNRSNLEGAEAKASTSTRPNTSAIQAAGTSKSRGAFKRFGFSPKLQETHSLSIPPPRIVTKHRPRTFSSSIQPRSVRKPRVTFAANQIEEIDSKVEDFTHTSESAIYLNTVESHCQDQGATQIAETDFDGDTGESHCKVQEVTHIAEPLVGGDTVESHCQEDGSTYTAETETDCDTGESHCKVQGAPHTTESTIESNTVTYHCEVQSATSASKSEVDYDTVISHYKVQGVTHTAVSIGSGSSASHYKVQAITHTAVSIDIDSSTSYSDTQVDAEVLCYGATSSENMKKNNNSDRPAASSLPQSPRESRSSENMRRNSSDRPTASSLPQSPREERSLEYMQRNNSSDRPTASSLPQNPRENRSSENMQRNNNSDRQATASLQQSRRENRSLDDLHDEGISFRPLSYKYLQNYISQRSGRCQSADHIPYQEDTSPDNYNTRGSTGETSSEREGNRRNNTASFNDNHRPCRLDVPCHSLEYGPTSIRPKQPFHYPPLHSVESREDASSGVEHEARRRTRLQRQKASFDEKDVPDTAWHVDHNYNVPQNSIDEEYEIQPRRMRDAERKELRNRRQRHVDEREIRAMLILRAQARERSSEGKDLFEASSSGQCRVESFDNGPRTSERSIYRQDPRSIDGQYSRSIERQEPDRQEASSIDRQDPRSNDRQEPKFIDIQDPISIDGQNPSSNDRQEPRSIDIQDPKSMDREDLRMQSRQRDSLSFQKRDSKGERHELKRQSRVTDTPKKQVIEKQEYEQGARSKVKSDHKQDIEKQEHEQGARSKVKSDHKQDIEKQEHEQGARSKVKSDHKQDIEKQQEHEQGARLKVKSDHKQDIEKQEHEQGARLKVKSDHKQDIEKQEHEQGARSKSKSDHKQEIEKQEKKKRDRSKSKCGNTQPTRPSEGSEPPGRIEDRHHDGEDSGMASGGQTDPRGSRNEGSETQDAPRFDYEGETNTRHMTLGFNDSAHDLEFLRSPTDAEILPRYRYMGEMEQAGVAAYVPAYSTWYRGDRASIKRAAVREVSGYSRSMDVTDTYERYSFSEIRSLSLATGRDISELLPRMPLSPVRNIIKKAEKVKLFRREYADVAFERAFESGTRTLPRSYGAGADPEIRANNSNEKNAAMEQGENPNGPHAVHMKRLKYSICFILIGAYGLRHRSAAADGSVIPRAIAIGCIPPFDKNDAHATIVIESVDTLWNSRWSLPLPAEELSNYVFDIYVWDARLHVIPRVLTGRTTVTIDFVGLSDQIRWLPLVISFSDRVVQSGNSPPGIAKVNGNFVGLHMSELEVRLELRLHEANVLLPRPLTGRRQRATNHRSVRFADDPNRRSKDDKDDKDEDTGRNKKLSDFCWPQ